MGVDEGVGVWAWGWGWSVGAGSVGDAMLLAPGAGLAGEVLLRAVGAKGQAAGRHAVEAGRRAVLVEYKLIWLNGLLPRLTDATVEQLHARSWAADSMTCLPERINIT